MNGLLTCTLIWSCNAKIRPILSGSAFAPQELWAQMKSAYCSVITLFFFIDSALMNRCSKSDFDLVEKIGEGFA